MGITAYPQTGFWAEFHYQLHDFYNFLIPPAAFLNFLDFHSSIRSRHLLSPKLHSDLVIIPSLLTFLHSMCSILHELYRHFWTCLLLLQIIEMEIEGSLKGFFSHCMSVTHIVFSAAVKKCKENFTHFPWCSLTR